MPADQVTQRDRDLAQMILPWATLDDDDDIYLSLPPGADQYPPDHCRGAAETAAGTAIGVYPAALADATND